MFVFVFLSKGEVCIDECMPRTTLVHCTVADCCWCRGIHIQSTLFYSHILRGNFLDRVVKQHLNFSEEKKIRLCCVMLSLKTTTVSS